MFTIEHLDGERLLADEQGWKVKEMSASGIEQSVISESPTMRPGRLSYGISHGNKNYTLVFTKMVSNAAEHEQLVEFVYFHFLRGEPFYLYRDFRKPSERTDLPSRRAKVVTKSVSPSRNGLKSEISIQLESYELPFEEDATLQQRTWTGTHQFTNSGGHRLDPRYCQMTAKITISGTGNELKVLFNGEPYFWYKKPVKSGDVFVVNGTDVTKNSYSCFEDCHKRTTFLRMGKNKIEVQGASCEVLFEYRALYL
ncbi:TPA: hypothetical protein U1617_001266 [Streptococcus suis]|nr:hypothetical protein [Streptococcus suis]HEM5490711.1 hypothetical protein [Streptococcus suis]